MSTHLLTDVSEHHKLLLGRHAVALGHSFAASDAFTDAGIASLIENAPVGTIHVMEIPPRPLAPGSFRHGVLDGITGREALVAASRGQVIIRLNDIAGLDPQLAGLLVRIVDEIGAISPSYGAEGARASLLITSPRVQRPMDCSPAAKFLWQVRGQTRVLVYPASTPFLPPGIFERSVADGSLELTQHYEPWFEEYAKVIDLTPGRLVHWPLSSPIRTINANGLNIAIETNHPLPATHTFRSGTQAKMVFSQPSPKAGAGSWLRRPLAALAHATRGPNQQNERVRIEFKLDPDAPDGIRLIEPFDMQRRADF